MEEANTDGLKGNRGQTDGYQMVSRLRKKTGIMSGAVFNSILADEYMMVTRSLILC